MQFLRLQSSMLTSFIYLFLAVLVSCCCEGFFSKLWREGATLVAVLGLLIAVSSLVAEHGLCHAGFSSLDSWALDRAQTVVVVHGLSCSTACGIFPDQGSNERLWHWQADSLPLSHQGSPLPIFEIMVL